MMAARKKKEVGPRQVSAVLRWANGDRQFIEVTVEKKPPPTVLFEVGESGGGDHQPGTRVVLVLNEIAWQLEGRLLYMESK